MERTHPAWTFWLKWVLYTAGGLVLVLILSAGLNAIAFAVNSALDSRFGSPVLALLMMSTWWAIVGASFGMGQWWAVRRELQGSGWWVLATLAGYPLGSLLSQVLPGMDPPHYGGPVLMFSFGISLGVLQWLVLRGRVARAGWWILISIAGWLLAFAATGAAYQSGMYVEPFDLLAAFLFPTAMSGAGMAWLLHQK